MMKEQIIKTAKLMFLKLGFKSVTMDDIASEIGISKKTIYKYFSNKDILIENTIELAFSEVQEIIIKIENLNLNAIEENFEMKRMFREMFKGSDTSPLYQLKKHYLEIYEKALTVQSEILIVCFRKNIIKGIKEGLYRENVVIDEYVKFYQILIFNINENTASGIEAEELELKALEYHIRAMATLAGIIELDKHLNNPII